MKNNKKAAVEEDISGSVKPGKRKKQKREKNKNSNGMRLAKRWRRGFSSVIFSRFSLVLLLLIFQAFLMVVVMQLFELVIAGFILNTEMYFLLLELLQFTLLVAILNSNMNSTAKLPWVLLIATVPYFGILFYLWTKLEFGHRKVRNRLYTLYSEPSAKLKQNTSALEGIYKADEGSKGLANYLYTISKSPVYENTSVKYYKLGEDKFNAMLEELEKAEKFIFIEYFIIAEGYMWGNILEILAKKAAQGVDVRVMYDGTCELSSLPYYYPKRMKKLGIKCKVWEPIKPVVTSSYNYRDHRKILVIDGKVAFTGGVNLADEYINKETRFGHWKDTAILIKGAAVDSFTVMFLQMWNVKEKTTEDFSKYLGLYDRNTRAKGYIIPYGETPLNKHKAGERVYEDILYNAKDYVYIMSPYLVLDDDLTNAMRFAAERGVDVRIILPGIPDKKAVFALAKSHYKNLMDAGVKIYAYTPGFVHAKVFVSDDKKAVVGTINLDYRSLYHHFECAAYMVDVPCISDILADYRETLPKCKAITYDTLKHEKLKTKLTGKLMKLIAPML